MKISVLGNIIETENIYQITPIIGNNCWTSRYSDLTHSNYYFTILFFNKEELTIYGDLKKLNLNESGINWWQNDYENKLKLIENQVTKLREKVIRYWSNNQSDIPKIEFI